MSEVQIPLTSEERDLLTRMLNQALRDKRVEIHRTEFSKDFREGLEHEEQLMQGMLDRLAATPSAT
jgi:hypothetical protein